MIDKRAVEAVLIITVTSIAVAIFWFIPAANHHGDIVRVCKEKGYVSGAIFGEDIKCEEMKVKK